ncbi:hypothetical protein FOXYSP1_06141 [Fusarium oxysporum f. sp. phaseoli]
MQLHTCLSLIFGNYSEQTRCIYRFWEIRRSEGTTGAEDHQLILVCRRSSSLFRR